MMAEIIDIGDGLRSIRMNDEETGHFRTALEQKYPNYVTVDRLSHKLLIIDGFEFIFDFDGQYNCITSMSSVGSGILIDLVAALNF